MDAKLQRRIQRYGWDLAAAEYEPLWQSQLAEAQALMLTQTAPCAGECVLDVATGTGLIALAAAARVGPAGSVIGIDISQRMVDTARMRALAAGVSNASFVRVDAEKPGFADAAFDAALCALGLMYLPEPLAALRELSRVVKPGGRIGLAVWGERSRCGWAPVFPIVDAEVRSEVCPLFFALGAGRSLEHLCAAARLEVLRTLRLSTMLSYAGCDEACDAAFIGGPVALAWSRFDSSVRNRVRTRYLDALEPWRCGAGYRIPGEFVVVIARRPRDEGTAC
jgi:ubiquinone/menaquinone biosynthesis C-methylase UbiE